MKLFGILLAGIALFSTQASAYNSPPSFDPRQGGAEVEVRTVVKSQASGYAMAVSRGHALYLSENELTGGATVSRFNSGTGTDAASAKYLECIAQKSIAADSEAPAPCVTRGYIDYGRYDATTAIVKGDYLCGSTTSGSEGVLVKCGAGVVSKFIAAEAKASGTGTNLKVIVR